MSWKWLKPKETRLKGKRKQKTKKIEDKQYNADKMSL